MEFVPPISLWTGRDSGIWSIQRPLQAYAWAPAMDPDRFAAKTLKQIARNKPIIMIPLGWKVLWWLNRSSPALAISMAHMISQAIFKKTEG